MARFRRSIASCWKRPASPIRRPIVHTLMTDEDTYRIYQLDGVVTTVDAEHGMQQLDTQFEPAKQIAIADRIVITKTDRAPADSVAKLEAPRARAQQVGRDPARGARRCAGVTPVRSRRP